MSTTRTTQVQIRNNTGGTAQVFLYHRRGDDVVTSFAPPTPLGPGEVSAPFKVEFTTGVASNNDYWAVMVRVISPTQNGVFVSAFKYGDDPDDCFTKCNLQTEDENQTLTFSVDKTVFTIDMPSGGTTAPMTWVAPYRPNPAIVYQRVTNVFVVVLENRSFDSLFAASKIPGIVTATAEWSNPIDNKVIPSGKLEYGGGPAKDGAKAPDPVVTDPGHEFPDVLMQLTQTDVTSYKGGAYPKVTNLGFASNWLATLPTDDRTDWKLQQIMWPCQMKEQLPVLHQLATEFAVCDNWFSSMPGPTWPNRYFVHAATSGGLDESPSTFNMFKWKLFSGVTFAGGTVFDSLKSGRIPFRLYADYKPGAAGSSGWSLYAKDPLKPNPRGGDYTQVSSLKGISVGEASSLEDFADDLQKPYPYAYTFIEPNYGNVTGPYDFKHGSSQHPTDDMYGGEGLIKAVYEAIRASPLWETSLLIITYDEHGGFADSVKPPSAPSPDGIVGDKYKFDFKQYGVRVPAVVVSPLIAKGSVDHTLYDHSSIVRTALQTVLLDPLTNRDRAANDVLHLASLPKPRTDCPKTLAAPASDAGATAMTAATGVGVPVDDSQETRTVVLPEAGNHWGFLCIAAKADLELSGGTEAAEAAITQRLQKIRTVGDAQDYLDEVAAKKQPASR